MAIDSSVAVTATSSGVILVSTVREPRTQQIFRRPYGCRQGWSSSSIAAGNSSACVGVYRVGMFDTFDVWASANSSRSREGQQLWSVLQD
jgi:hypothetical protein